MSKEKFMIECLTRDVIMLLMEEDGLSMREAMDRFYRSRTFESLTRVETGLYIQGAVYVLDEYRHEWQQAGRQVAF